MSLRALATLTGAVIALFSASAPTNADQMTDSLVEVAEREVRVGVTHSAPQSAARASSGEARTCRHGNDVVPCERSDGRWNSALQCYVRQLEEVTVDSPWNGYFTGRRMECTHVLTDESFEFWDVDGKTAEPPPDPRVLAEQAVSSMTLQPIDMGMNPPPLEDKPEAMSVVGWNNWLWATKRTKHNWGPITATANAGGYTVTATAKVKHVIWDMGNGDKIKCGKGTPWRRGWDPNQPSPTCNYMYEQMDQYTVTATSHWIITWEGIGDTGTFPMELSDTRTLEVGELHVLNVPTKKRR